MPGPISYISAVPITEGSVFPYIFKGSTNSKLIDCIGLVADLDTVGADATVEFLFELPQSLPTGTPKLRLGSMANATTGAVKVDVGWGLVAAGGNPDTVARTLEGTGTPSVAATVTWAAGNADDILETKIALDHSAFVAGNWLAMDLIFRETGSNLAVISGHLPSIVWE